MAELDIPVPVYNWIVDFFEGHTHRTVFNGEESPAIDQHICLHNSRVWHRTGVVRRHSGRPKANALWKLAG